MHHMIMVYVKPLNMQLSAVLKRLQNSNSAWLTVDLANSHRYVDLLDLQVKSRHGATMDFDYAFTLIKSIKETAENENYPRELIRNPYSKYCMTDLQKQVNFYENILANRSPKTELLDQLVCEFITKSEGLSTDRIQNLRMANWRYQRSSPEVKARRFSALWSEILTIAQEFIPPEDMNKVQELISKIDAIDILEEKM